MNRLSFHLNSATRMLALALLWLGLPLLTIERAQTQEHAGAQSIQIGVSLPLTGDLMEYGRAVSNGLELAQSKFPDKFRKLRLSYEDNKYDAAEAVAVFQKLRINKVDLIYSWGEPPLNAVAPLAEREQVPVIAMSLDVNPARKKRFIMRSINSPKELVSPVLDFLRQRGFKRLGVIKADDPYDNSCVDALKESLREGETLTVLGTALPEETDFRTFALKARAAPIDVLGLYLYPSQVSTLYRQLASVGVRLPSFGTDVFESNHVITTAGAAMEGAVYPNLSMPKWFAEEYVAKFGNDTQIAYAFNGYAWAAITADLFSKVAHRPSAEEILLLYTSVTGSEGGVEFRYRETSEGDRYWEFPVVLKTIKNGRFQEAR